MAVALLSVSLIGLPNTGRRHAYDSSNSGHWADLVPAIGRLSSERNVNTTDCLDSGE